MGGIPQSFQILAAKNRSCPKMKRNKATTKESQTNPPPRRTGGINEQETQPPTYPDPPSKGG